MRTRYILYLINWLAVEPFETISFINLLQALHGAVAGEIHVSEGQWLCVICHHSRLGWECWTSLPVLS